MSELLLLNSVNTALLDCLNRIHETTVDLDELCQLFLNQILVITKGTHGYVACSSALDPEKMKFTASVKMDKFIKQFDTKVYKPNRTFVTPPDLKDRWIIIPLTCGKKLNGVIGFEYERKKFESDTEKQNLLTHLTPLVPQLMSTMLESFISKRAVTTQQDLFLSTISHEIRTPLNGIVGMSRILKESNPLTDEQKSYINVVSECTYQLLELINDILDFSKMDCDQLSLDLTSPVDLRACLEEVYDLVYLRIQEKKMSLWCEVRDDVPQFILGDKKRIRQVILNLVNNAIKFTDRGQIHILVYVNNDNTTIDNIRNDNIRNDKTKNDKTKNDKTNINMNMFHVEVKDTGVGIPDSKKEMVFKNFQQIRTQRPNSDGVGLGLAICKKLCTIMGGEIEVKWSEIGKGTCMHFFIPMNIPPPEFNELKNKDECMELIRDKKILLIDSDMTRRMKWTEALVNLQTRLQSCSTPEEGSLFLKSMEFDACIVSPPIDSLTTTIPTLIIDKTISLQTLCISLGSLLKKSSNQKSPSSSDQKPPAISADILVVEDNPYNMMVICEMLKKFGFDDKMIDKAVTGPEAIQKGISKQYDIILMDLLLPIVDGISAGSQILTHYRNRCPKHLRFSIEKYDSLLPTIIALTAMVTSETQAKCKSSGFKGFLSKPIDKEELDTMLKIVLKRRQASSHIMKNTVQSDVKNPLQKFLKTK
jgi:signal transduction histidine kinase/CheY-like chemotaxis protein